MQCVLLAAGKGTRLRPLTDDRPKPLVPIAGKPLLDHIVNALPEVVDELVIVTGYRGEMLQAHCGSEYFGRRVRYAPQEDHAGGTGDALLAAERLIHGRFLLMYADDIHGEDALVRAFEKKHAMLAVRSKTPERYGVVLQNPDGTLREILEKPADPPSDLINVGGFVLDESILSYAVPRSSLGEVLLTDMVTEYAKDHPVAVVEQGQWLPIGYPEDIQHAETMLAGYTGADV